MSEEKIEIKREKKSAPTSFIPSPEASAIMQELMENEGLNKTDALNFIITQSRRYIFEQSSSQSQNFMALQGEFNKISEIFKAVVAGCDNTVENSIREANESQARYREQLVENDKIKKAFGDERKAISEEKKLLEQEIKRLNKELETIDEYKESVESRIADKDDVINTKEQQLQSFTKEIIDLKTQLESYKDVESEKQELREEIHRLEEAAAQTVIDHQEDLLKLRTELQNEFSNKIEAIFDKQAEKIEAARNELEERLNEKHEKAIKSMEDKQEKREQALENKHQMEIDRIRQEYQNEINELKEEHRKENK